MKLRTNTNKKLRELIDIYITNTPTETAIFNEKSDGEEKEDKAVPKEIEPAKSNIPDPNIEEPAKTAPPSNSKDFSIKEPAKTAPHPNSDDGSFVDKMLNAPTTADELIAALERKKNKKAAAKKPVVESNADSKASNSIVVKETNDAPQTSNKPEVVEEVTSSNSDNTKSLNTATEEEVSEAVSRMSESEKEDIRKIANEPKILIEKFEECETIEQAKELLLRLKGVHGDLHPKNTIGGITLTSYIYCIERLADSTDNITYDFITPIQKESREYIHNFKMKMLELIDNVVETQNTYYDAMEYMINVVNGDIL